MAIIRWETFKRKNNPDIYSVSDSSKPWVRKIIKPTLIKLGYKHTSIDCDCDKRKPIDIIKDAFPDHLKMDIIYSISVGNGNYDGYFKYVEIFFKK